MLPKLNSKMFHFKKIWLQNLLFLGCSANSSLSMASGSGQTGEIPLLLLVMLRDFPFSAEYVLAAFFYICCQGL